MKLFLVLIFYLLSHACLAQTVSPAPSSWSGTRSPDSAAELEQLMRVKEPSLPLERYDLISVHVFGADALTVRARISPEGGIDIPLAGHVVLQDLTVAEAQATIAKLLIDKGLMVTPAVTVDVLESPDRVVTVSGQVKNPGVYPVYGDSQLTSLGATPSSGVHTLAQVLALAGGLKDTASNIVTLYRSSLGAPIPVPLGTDPNSQRYASLPILPGDEVRVSNVGQAYVVGAVKIQGAIQLKNYSPTTVALAVSMSNGIGFEASADDSRLVRTEGKGRISIPVKVNAILRGKASDIILQNDDILYIPTNKTKAAIKGGGTGLIVSVASAFLYTH